jgi:Carboxypeptidase regulatory-like domain
MRLEAANRRAYFGLVILLTLASINPAWAQLYSGAITGAITDPSGAAVPGAAVTATELNRKYTYTATTDATGRFVLRAVPPGQYSLAVEARGFDKYVRESFPLDVSSTVTVDAALQLAKGLVAITVSDTSAPQLQTETAALGQTINRKLINDLPLVGRGLFDLVSLGARR